MEPLEQYTKEKTEAESEPNANFISFNTWAIYQIKDKASTITHLEAKLTEAREQLWKCCNPHTMGCSIHETDPKLIKCDCGLDTLLKGDTPPTTEPEE